MKNYLILAALLISGSVVSAQTIPNGDFEEWDIFSYGIPEFWNTSAQENLMDVGIVATTEVPGEVNSAIHMETMESEGTIFSGYFTNSSDDPTSGIGGTPYSGVPVAITGFYRYFLPAQDTALMIVICKNEGVMTSFDLFKIKGTGDQPEFAPFSFELSNTGIVDTVIIAATCSNLITEEGLEVGSWIEFDELGFTGLGPVMPPFPGGSFDNWTTYTQDRPLGWNVRGFGLSRVNDPYTNTYAIRLENESWEDGSLQPSSISTSEVNDGPPTGGLPYSNVVDTLCGYYRFLAPTGQVAAVSAMIYSNGMNIGGNYLELIPAVDYSYFELPLFSNQVPDTLGVEITSAAWPWDNALEGNALIVDHLQLKSAPLGVPLHARSALKLFPNPATDQLTLMLPPGVSGETLFIYDQQGRCVFSTRVTSPQARIETAPLPAGLYTYRLDTGTRPHSGQFIVIK